MYKASTLTPETTPIDPGIGYRLVRDLIFFQVHAFKRQFGGVVDELISEANLAFVKTHNQYITGKTPTGKRFTDDYATEISRSVWYRLFDSMRRRVRREHLCKMAPLETAVNVIDERNLNIFDLSVDARFVVALILDPPDSIITRAEIKGGEYRNYRSVVREYLKERNWAKSRIEQSFNEILTVVG